MAVPLPCRKAESNCRPLAGGGAVANLVPTLGGIKCLKFRANLEDRPFFPEKFHRQDHIIHDYLKKKTVAYLLKCLTRTLVSIILQLLF